MGDSFSKDRTSAAGGFLAGNWGESPRPHKGASPLRLFLAVAFSIFACEALIMGLFFYFPSFHSQFKILLDPMLLVILLSPVLYFCLFRPLITQLKEDDQTHEHMNHLIAVLRAIRNVNQLITREKDRDRLLKGACMNLVETKGYHNTWTAVLDESGNLTKSEEAGLDEAFLPMKALLERGELPICCRKALSQRGVMVMKDPPSTCSGCPLAPSYSGRAGFAVRLEHEGEIYGVLVSSVPEEYADLGEERMLFEEVTGDLAFALHDMKTQERHRYLEAEARRSRERYRTLVEESFDGIFVQKGPKIIFANQRLHQMLGYGERELVGLDHWLVYHPEYHEITKERARARMRGEEVIGHYEVKMQRKDGSWFYGEIGARAIDIDGEAGVQVWVRDIMQRKQDEIALKKSEATLKRVFEASPLGMGFVKNRVMQWHNRAMSKLLGYTVEELEGKNARMIYLNDAEFKGVEDAIRSVLEGADSSEVETKWVRKDGSVFDCHVHYALLEPGSKDRRVLAIVEDITDRKRAEQERKDLERRLRQAQKMEAIGTLAGGIAHDFNNILAGIIGLAELSLLDAPQGTPLRRNLVDLLKAGNRAKDLVKQILTFSRQREQEPIRFSINPIIKEAVKLVRSSLPSTIEIRQDIEENPGTTEGDPGQIHQVIMNLCANAEYAMRKRGGVLEIGLRRTEVDRATAQRYQEIHPGPYLELTVRDTGDGIPHEIMNRIFDPYFTTKGVGEGTGLGLAVAQGIVHKFRGMITVESRPDKGSRFRIFLPVVEEEQEAREAAPGKSLPSGNEHILLVDDEPLLAEVGGRMLGQLGYTVTTGAGAFETLELFRSRPEDFDLVISDITMPGMTGDQLALEIRKTNPDIPIILCTGFSHRISEERAKEIGIDALIMKPFTMKDLARKVRKALDGRNSGDEEQA